MTKMYRPKAILAGFLNVLALAGCGGGDGGAAAEPNATGNVPNAPAGLPPPAPAAPITPDSISLAPSSTNPTTGPSEPNAPFITGNIALDGLAWINFRRGQAGMSTLTRSSIIDIAAQGHSSYQSVNNMITHEQTLGNQGFTGATLSDRLAGAGYTFNTNSSRAYGEIIAATSNASGQYMAEELITAIYHRFVMFEPMFKEIGTGSAATSQGYTYFTVNFSANNGYGTGLPFGQVGVWPFNGQTRVPRNFFSDTELPDPVPDRNEVGYPISVHANIDATVRVTSFTVRPRGGANLQARLLTSASDTRTGKSSAAIVPLSPLNFGTMYEVTFAGDVNGTAVNRTWSFTTL